jgi:hypothetical protein
VKIGLAGMDEVLGVLPASVKKVMPLAPAWEVGRRPLNDSRWRSMNG